MTRLWGKLWSSFLIHPKFLRMSLTERGVWLTILLYAFNSTKDDDLGTRSEFTGILGNLGVRGATRQGGVIDRLVDLGLLDDREGRLRLHDWGDWQPADPTGAARKRTERAAQRDATVASASRDSRLTDDEWVADLLNMRVEEKNISEDESLDKRADRSRAEGETTQASGAREWLDAHGCRIKPGNGHDEILSDLTHRFGEARVIQTFITLGKLGVMDGDVRGFIFGARDHLYPRPDLAKLEATKREAELARAIDRQVKATQVRITPMLEYLSNSDV